MCAAEFAKARMVCIAEQIFQEGEWVILEWCDPPGPRGSGFFHIVGREHRVQRCWDKLTFLRLHYMPLPGHHGADVNLGARQD
jgi:hypothetical protein